MSSKSPFCRRRVGARWGAWVPALCTVLLGLGLLPPTFRTTGEERTDERFDQTHWKLTLPLDRKGGREGDAAEIEPAQVTAGYVHKDYFQREPDGTLVFWCPVNGATTKGSDYPRSELREMLDPDSVSTNWMARGTHILAAECRVRELPSSQKVIIGQIHSHSGKAKPLIKLQFYKNRVEALVKISPDAGSDRKLVFPEVALNADIAYQIKLQDSRLDITVNGTTQSEDILQNDSSWGDETFYFKAGAYCQDNEGPATEGARVSFSRLRVHHSESAAVR